MAQVDPARSPGGPGSQVIACYNIPTSCAARAHGPMICIPQSHPAVLSEARRHIGEKLFLVQEGRLGN